VGLVLISGERRETTRVMWMSLHVVAAELDATGGCLEERQRSDVPPTGIFAGPLRSICRLERRGISVAYRRYGAIALVVMWRNPNRCVPNYAAPPRFRERRSEESLCRS